MVIIDSSVMIDYLGGVRNAQTDWLELHIGTEPLGITNLILSEVLQGIRSDKRFADTLEALDQFVIFETGSTELAIAAARNYRTLRGIGITVRNTIDTFVATFCIENGHHLLHRDSDFDHFHLHLGLLPVDLSTVQPN
jgi:predicted nucleic acid-binding protein